MSSQSIYTVGGTVQAGRGIYIPRSADDELLAACREGSFAYVLTARQMGKSSLMVRTAQRLKEEGICPVIVDLTELGVQTSAQEWYLGLMARIASRLGLRVDLFQWWQQHEEMGVTQRLSLFFQELILPEVEEPIVIFIDEIDSTLSLDFTDDFFATVRYLYNARSTEPALRRLSFVLIGVATPSDLIDDPHRTPFNIGRRLDLADFTAEEAAPLALGLAGDAEAQTAMLDGVLSWTGGHPYLTQRLCDELARRNGAAISVEATVADIFLGENSRKDNNLQFVADMLTRRAPGQRQQDVLAAYQTIRLGRRPVPDEEHSLVKSHLKLSGVVKRAGPNLSVRNRIYERVFDRSWIRAQWPVTWWDLVPPEMKVAATVSLLLLIALITSTWFALSQQRVAQASANSLASEVAFRATAEAGAVEAQLAAEAQARLATARELAAMAGNTLELDPELSLLLALESLETQYTSDGERMLRQGLQQSRVVLRLEPDVAANASGRDVFTVYSPDGRLIAASTFGMPSASQIWDADSGELLISVDGDDPQFSADGSQLVTTFWSDVITQPITVALSSPLTGERLRTVTFRPADVGMSNPGVVYAPDLSLVAMGDETGVAIWDLKTGELVRQLDVASLNADLLFSPDSHRLAVKDDGNEITLWDVATGRLITTLSGFSNPAELLAFSPDGNQLLVTIYVDDDIQLWDISAGQLLFSINRGTTTHINGGFSGDGARFATGGADGEVVVWDAATGEALLWLKGHEGWVKSLMFNPDGSRLLTGASDGTARVWDVTPGGRGELLTVSGGPRRSVALSGDGALLAAASFDGTAALWDTAAGDTLHVLAGHMGAVHAVAVRPDGSLVATGGADGNVTLWDAKTGAALLTLNAHDPDVMGVGGIFPGVFVVAFSPDGTQLATGGADGQVLVWDVPGSLATVQGQLLWSAESDIDGISALAYSDDGVWLAGNIDATLTAIATGSITQAETIIWDARTGQELVRRPNPDSYRIFGLDISPDRSLIATSRVETGEIDLWEAATGEIVSALDGHAAPVIQLDFSPDGALLVSGGLDQTVRVWDLATGTTIATFTTFSAAVTDVLFTPDGKHVLATSLDGTVQMFTLDRDELMALARSRVTRSLTEAECLQYLHNAGCEVLVANE